MAMRQILLENVVPDPAKLEEVKLVEAEFRQQYSCLHRRLGRGEILVDPQDIMSLVSETVDCLLQRLAPHRGKRAIFLIGSSGSGKSTVANWLLGSKVIHERVKNEHGDEVLQLKVLQEFFKVGHGLDSKTLIPNVGEVPGHSDIVLVDYPGFKDTTSLEVRLGVDVALREAFKLFRDVHVLSLISIYGFQDERGSGARAQLSKFMRLLPTEGMPLGANETASSAEACVWWLGITKCEKAFVPAPNRMFQDAVELVRERGFQCKVLNINQMLCRSDDSREAGTLCEQLLAETHVPVPAAVGDRPSPLQRAFSSAFGAPPDLPKVLMTDCLNSKDCAAFQKAFMTTDWSDQFLTTRPDVDFDLAGDGSFADAKEVLQRNREAMQEFVDEINEDARAMIEGRTLGTERRSQHVRTLCGYQQCRMKLVFLHAEQRVLDAHRAAVAFLVDEMAVFARQLEQGGCMTAGQLNEVTRVVCHIDKALRREGYNGTQHHRETVAGTTGFLDKISQGLAWVGNVDAAVEVGKQIVKALGGMTVACLCAVFAVAVAAYKAWEWYQRRIIAEELQQSLLVLKNTFDAITRHRQVFEALKKDLAALEILECD